MAFTPRSAAHSPLPWRTSAGEPHVHPVSPRQSQDDFMADLPPHVLRALLIPSEPAVVTVAPGTSSGPVLPSWRSLSFWSSLAETGGGGHRSGAGWSECSPVVDADHLRVALGAAPEPPSAPVILSRSLGDTQSPKPFLRFQNPKST